MSEAIINQSCRQLHHLYIINTHASTEQGYFRGHDESGGSHSAMVFFYFLDINLDCQYLKHFYLKNLTNRGLWVCKVFYNTFFINILLKIIVVIFFLLK